MGVKFAIARRQPGQELENEFFVHARVLHEAEHGAGVPDAFAPEQRMNHPPEVAKQRGVAQPPGQPAAGQPHVQPETIAGQPQAPDAPGLRMLQEDLKDHWMEVHVQVTVDVVERETRGSKLRELRGNFVTELRAKSALEEVTGADSHGVVAKLPALVDEAGNSIARERG